MAHFRDILGQRFGRLTVIEKTEKRSHKAIIWICKCDCGNIKEIVGNQLTVKNINRRLKSCGCKEGNLKHGMAYSRLHSIWRHMKGRCYNPNNNRYVIYGKRGIKVCERWLHSFENFWEDMKDGYANNLTLDRINVNGNYEPNNCRWATQKEQQNNRRNNKQV